MIIRPDILFQGCLKSFIYSNGLLYFKNGWVDCVYQYISMLLPENLAFIYTNSIVLLQCLVVYINMSYQTSKNYTNIF